MTWSVGLIPRFGAPIHGEFTCALHPEELLKPAPEIIWPGLMAADLLPMVGNHYGDWICIRMNESNRLEEVVYWYHGGGDCLPLAAGLSEAILLSHYVNLDPMEFSHQAIDSLESNLTHPNETRISQASRDLLTLRWAAEQQKLNLDDLHRSISPRDEIIQSLLDLKIAVIALMCLRAKDALRHWPRQRFDQIWTEDPMDRSGCISRYLFDQDSVPPAADRSIKRDDGRISLPGMGRCCSVRQFGYPSLTRSGVVVAFGGLLI